MVATVQLRYDFAANTVRSSKVGVLASFFRESASAQSIRTKASSGWYNVPSLDLSDLSLRKTGIPSLFP